MKHIRWVWALLAAVVLTAVVVGYSLPSSAGGVFDTRTSTANIRDFGAVCNRTTDDSAAIQAAINSIPQSGSQIGGRLEIPAGGCLVNSTLSFNGLVGIRVVGEAGLSYQESSSNPFGASLIAGMNNETLISIDSSSFVNHWGPEVDNLNLMVKAGKAGVTLMKIRDTNRVAVNNTTFRDAAVGVSIDSALTQISGGDASWEMFENDRFINNGIGIDSIQSYGFTVDGGDIQSSAGQTGIKIDGYAGSATSMHERIYGAKFDGGTTCVDSVGGGVEITDDNFERCSTAVSIHALSPATNESGVGNMLASDTFVGSGVETGINIQSGAVNTRVIAADYVFLGVNLINNGTGTVTLGA